MSKSPKFPEEISWIVDKNPVTAYLTRRGYKGWELYDVEQDYKEYYEYDFLVKACKKFKFQPNDLKSAENLLLVLDKWVAFAQEFEFESGEDGLAYVAAQGTHQNGKYPGGRLPSSQECSIACCSGCY